jgi:hypothetical protein
MSKADDAPAISRCGANTERMPRMEPLELQLFDAYKANLAAVRPERHNKDIMLCPLCISEITRKQVEMHEVGLEHIIPQHSTADKAQKSPQTLVGVKNVRSGLTITCSKCNGRKGRILDWPMRDRIIQGQKLPEDYPCRTGTAVLIYAYLLAFAVFGYEYILKDDLREIREQFWDPDRSNSGWLRHAQVNLSGKASAIVCNESGYPFVMKISPSEPLEMSFWRFRAILPPTGKLAHYVAIPEAIINLAHQEKL